MAHLRTLAIAVVEAFCPAWPDVLGACVVVVFALMGLRRGLWFQIAGVLGIIAAAALARALAPALGVRLHGAYPVLGQHAADGLAWSVSFAFGLAFVAGVVRIGTATLEVVQLRWIDRCAGALVGAFGGACFHVVVMICLGQLLPPGTVARALEDSRTEQLRARIERIVPTFLGARATARFALVDRASEAGVRRAGECDAERTKGIARDKASSTSAATA